MAPFDLSYWHATTKTYAYFREFGFFRIFLLSKKWPYHGSITFWKYNGKSIFWLFKILTEMLQKKFFEQKYGHSHFKSALKINFRLREVVKKKIHVYAYTCVFSLTISRSRKFIFKADLKWECPYFYSKFFFWSISVSILKVKKWISYCILKMWLDHGRVTFLTKKKFWKSETP